MMLMTITKKVIRDYSYVLRVLSVTRHPAHGVGYTTIQAQQSQGFCRVCAVLGSQVDARDL